MTTQKQTFTYGVLVSLFSLVALLLSGCQNYQLGSSSPLSFKSIYIAPVQNDSFAPQAQAQLSIQIRETFIRDGRIQVVSKPDKADVVLETTLTEYRRPASARSSTDTVEATDFDLTLEANFSLFENKTSKFLLNNARARASVNTKTNNPYQEASITNSDSFHLAERQAMPLLARDLAREITDQILSPW